MECHYFSDSNQNTIFIQKTYGKLLLILEFMVVFSLQMNMVDTHFYGQSACLVMALCRLVWKLTSQATVDKHVVFGRSGLHRIAWQVLEF